MGDGVASGSNLHGGGEMFHRFLLVHHVHFQCLGARKTVEEAIVACVEPDAGHLVQHFHPVVVEQDALAAAGQHLDATATILELHPCHHMPLLAAVCNLCRLSVCHSVRHGDVSAKPVVDVVHHLSKQAAMRRSVFQSVIRNIIMYHLMDDGIFQHPFRPVGIGADAQSEVVEYCRSAFVSFLFVGAGTEIGFGTTELNGDFGEFAGEYESVELSEFLLYIRYAYFDVHCAPVVWCLTN